MSDYKEVIAIVEGKTEQIFIERILCPYLAQKGIYIHATQVSKPGQKGGDVRFSRVSRDLGDHLKQRKDTIVTTLVDYYGTNEWPGLETLPANSTPAQISTHLHQATQQAVDELFPDVRAAERFVPFIAMHEFEALLFSDSEILAAELGINEADVTLVLKKCGSPEAINNSPETAPSKRLNRWSVNGKFPKITKGIAIADKIGIQAMRSQCPLFDAWLSQLEAKLEVD